MTTIPVEFDDLHSLINDLNDRIAALEIENVKLRSSEEKRRSSLFTAMWDKAMDGNATMQIWVGRLMGMEPGWLDHKLEDLGAGK